MGSSLQVYEKNEKLEMWSKRIQDCRSSGKSTAQWCRDNGISKHTYYEWQRKVFNEWSNRSEEQNGIVDVTPQFTGHSALATVYRKDIQIDVYDSSVVLKVLGLC